MKPSQGNAKKGNAFPPLSSKRKSIDRSAVYKIDEAAIDVTDLLAIDYEIVEFVANILSQLESSSSDSIVKAQLETLRSAMARIGERHSDRLIEIARRFDEIQDRKPDEATRSYKVKTEIAAQCARINRLAERAQRSDYVNLHTGGQDQFSVMSLFHIEQVILRSTWLEMNIRLRAAGMLTPSNQLKAARWIARGLDVRHALAKVFVDNETYAATKNLDAAKAK